MTDKKSNISIELVIIVMIILVVAFVALTIFGRNSGRFAQWFNYTFTNEAKAQEITQFTEKSLIECFEMDTSSNIPFNGENLRIKPEGTENFITINVSSSSGNELNCGKQNVMQLNKGAADCCESPDTKFCAQFLGITSTGEEPDCTKIAYFSKDDWKLPISYPLCADNKECSNHVEFWIGLKKYDLTFVRATVSPLTFTKYATFSAVTYDEKGNKVNACNENTFTVESGDTAACSNAEGQAFVVDLQKLPTFKTPNQVTISITPGTPMVLKGG